MRAAPGRMAGAAALVSAADQQATRERMEAEFQAQRAQRAHRGTVMGLVWGLRVTVTGAGP